MGFFFLWVLELCKKNYFCPIKVDYYKNHSLWRALRWIISSWNTFSFETLHTTPFLWHSTCHPRRRVAIPQRTAFTCYHRNPWHPVPDKVRFILWVFLFPSVCVCMSEHLEWICNSCLGLKGFKLVVCFAGHVTWYAWSDGTCVFASQTIWAFYRCDAHLTLSLPIRWSSTHLFCFLLCNLHSVRTGTIWLPPSPESE